MPTQDDDDRDSPVAGFGRWLRARMDEQGLTQEALAGAIGITQQTVSKYVSKDHTPDAKYLIPLANALGVSVFELLDAIAGRERTKEERARDANAAISYLREEITSLQGGIAEERRRRPGDPSGGTGGRHNSR